MTIFMLAFARILIGLFLGMPAPASRWRYRSKRSFNMMLHMCDPKLWDITRLKNILFIYFFLIGLSACRSSQQWPPQPSDIHLGEDSCAKCRMIISDERYGAQLFDRGKPVELFDDYGCLLSRRGVTDSNKRVVYVRSLEDASWIREDQAFYVVSKQISSPMGYGIAAFAAKESAARFAQGIDDSEIYSFSDRISVAAKIVRAGSEK